MSSNKTQIVKEFELISKDGFYESIEIDEVFYKELEEFAKTDKGCKVLQFANNGKCLQAKNYVGTIQTKSGFTLEILPKTLDDNEDEEKEIFIKLLHILYKLPNYKHIDSAKFDNLKKIKIFEIFIFMFLEEVKKIIKIGLKSDYIAQEYNLFYLKGKLVIKEQISKNFINKERFYVRYDEYSQNRAENRLIKATLQKLSKISKNQDNKRLLKQCLEHMSFVEVSKNIVKDFALIKKNRDMQHYENALIWAKIFLQKESFSSFSGDTIAFAILYPMEKLFEAFVGWYLANKKYNNYLVYEQYELKSFVREEKGKKQVNIKPDFVIKTRKDDIVEEIADAKWKIIDRESNKKDKKDFNVDDFYHMFAYKSILSYDKDKDTLEPKLTLYYPKMENNKDKYFIYFDGSKISINFLDLKEELFYKNRTIFCP